MGFDVGQAVQVAEGSAGRPAGGRVRLAREGPIAWLTLSNPGRLGAMDRGMWRALADLARRLAASDARCIVVQGEGEAFCAGGDIAEYPSFRFDPAALRHFHENEVWPALDALLGCDQPLVAAIGGPCVGAGLEIACCCDLRLAVPGASFGAPVARLGFAMAPRELALVEAVLGQSLARCALVGAQLLPAERLMSSGFLLELVDRGALPDRVRRLAQQLMALAPGANRRHKRMLRAVLMQKLAPGLEDHGFNAIEIEADGYAWATDAEHREGIAAFLDKRPPRFDGHA